MDAEGREQRFERRHLANAAPNGGRGESLGTQPLGQGLDQTVERRQSQEVGMGPREQLNEHRDRLERKPVPTEAPRSQ